MLTAYEIIRKKRDGGILSSQEIDHVVREFTAGRLPEYQVSSLLMAIFFKGMTDEETFDLTRSMMATGTTVDLSDVQGCKADKHSTGGVGDKISLILAPLAAACGIKVPMVSGRGLGHTGGTIDKLESIPGFRTKLATAEYKDILRKIGVVMSAQSDDLVPADRKLYGLRDVTATVESIPLISSSIMSKKLSEGVDALVLDVKVGNGAFMKYRGDARELASKMVQVGRAYGKKVAAYLTDMNQPLGREIGNWNEVVESLRVLRGESSEGDLLTLTTTLAAEMLSLCSGESFSSSKEKIKHAIDSGAGYNKFLEMVRAQDGEIRVVEDPSKYKRPEFSYEIKAAESGFVTTMDTFKVGMASVKLGAGRLKIGDRVDPLAGITVLKKIGDKVSVGDVLAIAYSNEKERTMSAVKDIASAYSLSQEEPEKPELIKERIA